MHVLEGKQTSRSFNDHREAVDFQPLVKRVGPAKAIEVWRIERDTDDGYTVASWCRHHVDHLTGPTALTKPNTGRISPMTSSRATSVRCR